MIFIKKLISIIVPCYNEGINIDIFYNEFNKISKKLQKYNFELIYAVDFSTDNSYEIIRKLNKKDKRIKYIFMSNRYGKEANMLAGLEKSKGDYVAIIDADLQEPIELLSDMINYLESGKYDSVATRRTNRKGEPIIRSFFSILFYKLLNITSKLDLKSGARDYRLMNRKMVNAILLSKEKNRFLKGIYAYTGFNTKWLEFQNNPRERGKTKWSFWSLFRYALTCIFGFTSLPLLIITFIGLILLIISMIIFIIMLIYFLCKNNINNIILLINSMMFFSSIQILCMSILCNYLYEINIEVKNRPIYIISETEEDK